MIAFLIINENDSGILSQDSVLSEAAFGKHIGTSVGLAVGRRLGDQLTLT